MLLLLLLLLLGLRLGLLRLRGLLLALLAQGSRASQRACVFVNVVVVARSAGSETGSGGALAARAEVVVQSTLGLVALLGRLLANLVVVESVQVRAVIVSTGRRVCLMGSVRRLSLGHGRGLVDGLAEHRTGGGSRRSLVRCSCGLAHREVLLVRRVRGVCGNAISGAG